MPSLFKRRSDSTVAEAEPLAETTASAVRTRGYTPGKGKATPKRTAGGRRVEAPPANNREAAKKSREKAREDRQQRRAAMMAGDEKYLLPRDKGAERALVRDIVDKRFTIGTWFFGGALLVLIGSSRSMPPIIQLVSNLLWALLAVATLADSLLLAREVKREIAARHPKTEQKMMSLYLYAAMRGLTFRRMRMPKPRVKIGAKLAA